MLIIIDKTITFDLIIYFVTINIMKVGKQLNVVYRTLR